MFGWIPLLSTLAQAAPVTALDTDKPIVTFQPAFIPAGVACRYHIPVGASATVFVGFGIADQVLNVEVTNIRLQPEIGADFYLGERYRALFVAPRLALAYWSGSVIIGDRQFGSEEGGTNIKGGVMFGGRTPVGDGGGTFGFAAGMMIHTYTEYHATSTSDGVQALPQVEFDLGLPNSRRSRD
jgi:hypothetical protein